MCCFDPWYLSSDCFKGRSDILDSQYFLTGVYIFDVNFACVFKKVYSSLDFLCRQLKSSEMGLPRKANPSSDNSTNLFIFVYFIVVISISKYG